MKKHTNETFLALACSKHDDKYDYSRVQYISSHAKIEVGCPDHGWFWQKACAHLLYGCKDCGNQRGTSRRITRLDEFVTRAGHKHQNRYDYTLVNFACQHDLIQITCPMHGVFRQAANDHLKGHGCKQCGCIAVERRGKQRRGVLGYDTEEFIRKAKVVHGERFCYDSTTYQGSDKSLTITCETHGNFQQSASNHLQGNGCVKCSGIGRRTTFAKFEQRAREVHSDRYDYQYFSKLTDKVGIICPDHGLFAQIGNDHVNNKAGCPLCSQSMTADSLRYSRREFEQMLTEKWEDRVSLVGDYTDLTTPTTFCCFSHSEFVTTPERALTRKHGCPQCWNAVRGITTRLTQEEFERRAHLIHGSKYQYGIYTKKGVKIEIECPIHGVFHQDPGNHLAGNGCPNCAVHKTLSQNRWLDRLGVQTREIWLSIGGRRIKADGYDANTRTIYEFWGDFWHGNPKLYDSNDINTATGKTFGELYERTLEKRRLIVSHGFKLVEIWEHDWRKIDNATRQRNLCPQEP